MTVVGNLDWKEKIDKMGTIEMPQLNSTIFSLDSIEGILLIVLAIFIIKYSSKKIVDIIFSLLGVALVFELLYILGNTPLDNYTHISSVFKYDIFSSIAQLVPGTKLAEWLQTAGYVVTNFMYGLVDWVIHLPDIFFSSL